MGVGDGSDRFPALGAEANTAPSTNARVFSKQSLNKVFSVPHRKNCLVECPVECQSRFSRCLSLSATASKERTQKTMLCHAKSLQCFAVSIIANVPGLAAVHCFLNFKKLGPHSCVFSKWAILPAGLLLKSRHIERLPTTVQQTCIYIYICIYIYV